MLRLTALLLPCAFLLTHSAAMADSDEDAWALQFCRGGISHNPMEYASPRDLGLAVAALIGFIERFEPEALTAG